MYLFEKAKLKKGSKKATNIIICAYTDIERARSGSKWIGKIIQMGKKTKTRISLNDRQFKYLGEEPVVKFGLTERQRIRIYQKCIICEDKAIKIAGEKFPSDYGKKKEHSKELKQAFWKEIVEENGITNNQFNQIVKEGVEKDWPTPPK